MNKHLCWEPQYAFEKIFILTTRWQLVHLPNLTLDERSSISDLFIPDEIKKIRNIRSIASYEIIWKKEHSVIEMLKEYKEQVQDDDNVDDTLLTSIEPQNLVLNCYPQLVEIFENTRNVKTRKRTAKSRVKKSVTNVEGDVEIKNTTKSRQKKTRKKIADHKTNKKVDEFISVNCPVSLEDSFENMSITPKRSKQANTLSKINELKMVDTPENGTNVNVKQIKRGPQFKRVLEMDKINARLNNTIDRMFNELSPDDFMSENDEDNDLNVTDVIENICRKRIFQFSSANCQPVNSIDQPIDITEDITEGCTKIESSTPNTEKYIYVVNEKEKSDDSDDDFGNINESYVPINLRIQTKESKELLQMCNQIEKESCFAFENLIDETDNGSMHLST